MARMLRKVEGMWRERRRHTFSIALLVGATFHTLFPLLSLRVNALFSDAVLDAAEAGTGVVAFLARLLAVCACVLDLPALRTERLGRNETRWERVHVHRHARVSTDGMDCHLGLGVGGLRIREVVAVGRLISLDRGHGEARWSGDMCCESVGMIGAG